MAWRSGGVTNNEMVDNLKRFGVIRSQAVEDGFRAVDRKFFVPPSKQHLAHMDQPVRDGKLHISAPHIYGSVCEALDLTPNSASSFLNIGAGTGYLTCIVAQILGPTSSSFAIEIHQDCVAHSQQAMMAWQQEQQQQGDTPEPHIQIIHGDGLRIDEDQGEAAVGFDRIYIGAAIERYDLPQIANLLRPGGILVGPVGDELMKVVRLTQSVPRSQETPAAVPRTLRGRPPLLSADFTTKVLSPVLFTPLVQSTSTRKLVIPSRVWEPSLHRYYPSSFRQSCKELLLCAAAPRFPASVGVSETSKANLASMLPRAVWMDILSYTHRHWFDQPQSEENLLRHRVQMLEASLENAQEARQDLEKRLRIAEGERELYRQMARTWQSRIERVLGETLAGDILDGAIVVMRQDNIGGSDEDSDSHGSSSNEDDDESDDDMEEDSVAEMEETPGGREDSRSAGASEFGAGRQVRAVSIASEHT